MPKYTKMEEDYIMELEEFYAPHFSNIDELRNFIQQIYCLDSNTNKEKQMFFQVQCFVTLVTDINKIRPARDGLRILFFKCCLESLAKLSNSKKNNFYELFVTMFSDEGKSYILSNFSLTSIECKEDAMNNMDYLELTMEDILSIIKCVRDKVVHDGVYWDLQMFAHDNDSIWLSSIETKEQVLSKNTYDKKGNKLLKYYFNTQLQYEKFKFYFVEACLNYINYYMKNKS